MACSHSTRQVLASLACYVDKKACCQDHSANRELALAKAQSMYQFEKDGGVVVSMPAAPTGAWKCQDCLVRFSCRASLASHRPTVHGDQARVASASRTQCAVCSQEWWTTHGLREHLGRSSHCRVCYVNADLDPAEPFEAVGHKNQPAWRPPLGTMGPWWATLRPTVADHGENALGQGLQALQALRKLAQEFRTEDLPT